MQRFHGYAQFTQAAKALSPQVNQMYLDRDKSLRTLCRVCSIEEAAATYAYCVAGGQYQRLTTRRPSEQQAVNQVGNNEGILRTGIDPRMALLLKLQKKTGVNVNLTSTVRTVVEFSEHPAIQFQGTVIKVQVNSSFCTAGSRLSFEGGGGWLLQIGTPLHSVQLDDKALTSKNAAKLPLPPDDTVMLPLLNS